MLELSCNLFYLKQLKQKVSPSFLELEKMIYYSRTSIARSASSVSWQQTLDWWCISSQRCHGLPVYWLLTNFNYLRREIWGWWWPEVVNETMISVGQFEPNQSRLLSVTLVQSVTQPSIRFLGLLEAGAAWIWLTVWFSQIVSPLTIIIFHENYSLRILSK